MYTYISAIALTLHWRTLESSETYAMCESYNSNLLSLVDDVVICLVWYYISCMSRTARRGGVWDASYNLLPADEAGIVA